MNGTNTKYLLAFLTVAFAVTSRIAAATKDDYRAACLQGIREVNSFGRAQNMTRRVLAGTKDGKIEVVGRGEIMFLSRLLIAGRQAQNAEMLELAKNIVLACNKAALDGYDTPQENSIEQISYALREFSLAVPRLKEMHLLTGDDATRADETMRHACEFLMRYRPEAGDGNLDLRYALGVASVLQLFPDDPRAPKWRAWAAKPFEHVLHYPYQYSKGIPGAVKHVLEKRGDRWGWAEDKTPFEHVQGTDISEDSSAYQSSTIFSWIGIGRLLGREAEMKTPEVRAFLERFYQQQMPVGVLPAYGDADWNVSAPEWIGIFEWAGSAFHEPKYRAAADAIYRYNQNQHLPLGDLSEAVELADEGVKPVPAPRSTTLLTRISGRGERVPDKIILRGDDQGGDAQPYVMLMATESLGHSHPYAGAIGAYGAGGAVFLSSLGYDATVTPLHQSFLVRPALPPFIKYFGDCNGTLLAKRDSQGRSLNDYIPSDAHELRSAEARETGGIAYGKVVCDYLTAWHPDRAFNGHAFLHTREAALDKASGILCVRDTLESKDGLEAAFGPVWHLQRVLSKTESAFLCENEFQSKIDGHISASKPHPVSITMCGPEGTVLNDTFWRFTSRAGHAQVAQEHHLTAEWRGNVTPSQRLAFVTVFVPMPDDAKTPEDVQIHIDGDKARIKTSTFEYTFPTMP